MYGKGKLDEYCDILITETPYYYAAVVLHPNKKLAWLKDKWRRYPGWLKTVKSGMKSLVAAYSKEMEDREAEMKAEVEPLTVSRKLTATRQKERDKLLKMGIVSSDEDDNLYASTMHVDASCSDHTRSEAARLDNELAYWNWLPFEDVSSPL